MPASGCRPLTRRCVPLLATLALLAASPLAYAGGTAALSYTIADPALQWVPCPDFIPKGCQIAVLHGDPAKPNVDVFFKIPSGVTVPKHTHTSAERMVLVSGELEVRYDGQPPVTLKTGAYAYGPAGKAHVATCAKGPDCVLFIAFEAPMDAIAVPQP